MDEAAEKQLLELFEKCDTDKNGKLSAAELLEMLTEYYTSTEDETSTPSEIKGLRDILMKMGDSDDDTMLNKDEILNVLHVFSGDDEKAQMKALFNMFDADKNGNLTNTEVAKFCKEHCEIEDDEILGQIMAMADENGDGKISFEEFCKLLDEW